MNSIDLKMTLQVPQQLLLDMLTVCVEEEGGIHWLASKGVQRDEQLNVVRIIKPQSFDDPRQKWPDVVPDTMLAGIRNILSGNCRVPYGVVGAVLSAVVDAGSPDWDIRTAGCVLQAGMFGEVVYDY